MARLVSMRLCFNHFKESLMKKLLILLCAALLVGCTPIRPPPAETAARTSLNVCYSTATAVNGILTYALAKGLYAKYGLEVNLVYIEGGSKATAALIAGQVDICQVSGASIVGGAVAGADVVIIAGLINTYTFSLMVTPEIAKAADLQGKTLGVSDFGGSSDTSMPRRPPIAWPTAR